MPLSHHASATNELAMRWATRSAYGTLSPGEHSDLEAWLAADRRHRGAYLRAQAGLIVMEDAVTGASDSGSAFSAVAETPEGSNDNDRASPRAARWAIAAAASLALAIGLGTLQLRRPTAESAGQAIPAASGREMILADGSVATLEPGANIEVAFLPGIRRITLTAGEASFKVAKNPVRPFVVRSGEVFAQATGTVYSVARTGKAGGHVSVDEGSVLVWSRGDRDQAVLLHAGDELILNPRPPARQSPAASPSPPPPELAQISLDNVTIAEAAERFNRLNEVKIVISDDSIGSARIVGLFNANDPQQFAAAAAAVAGARDVRRGQSIFIEMK